MGFRLKVEGADTIELGIESIEDIKFKTDTPNDSDARSTDLGVTAEIRGKILTAVDGEAADQTIKLAKWSYVPAEDADCYRKVTIEVVSASQIVRQISFPNAFVIDYKEQFGDEAGVGNFCIIIKQKKDKTSNLKFEGGFGE